MNDTTRTLSSSAEIETRTTRKITFRLMPFLVVLFMVAFIDRVNVGFANLQMSNDLGFSAEVFGFGAGIFFIGYFLLEIPGTLIVEKWSARKWLARIIISWGVLATATGFIETATQFYIARFLLGMAEAGFFPGVIVYLSHWFRSGDRAKTVAMFMAALPISNIIVGPVSGLILGLNWLGLLGWRWVFILEGVPAVLLGVVTIFFLTDKPHQAKWLDADERHWITEELERERAEKNAVRTYGIFEALRHRNVILLALIYFLAVTSAYGINFWLPTILKGLSGYTDLQVSLLSILPYCAGLVAMLLVGWSSDRRGERRWHSVISMVAVSVGLFLSSLMLEQNVFLALAAFCVVGAGIYSFLPVFWTFPTMFLTEVAAAACIGLINSVGNLGGFVGPYAVGYMNNATGSFSGGIIYLSASALVAALLILAVRHTPRVTPPVHV